MPLRKNRLRRAKTNPNDLFRIMTGSKPWYESTTIRRAIISLISFLLVAFKLDATGAEIEAIVAGIFGVIVNVMIIRGRVGASKEIR